MLGTAFWYDSHARQRADMDADVTEDRVRRDSAECPSDSVEYRRESAPPRRAVYRAGALVAESDEWGEWTALSDAGRRWIEAGR